MSDLFFLFNQPLFKDLMTPADHALGARMRVYVRRDATVAGRYVWCVACGAMRAVRCVRGGACVARRLRAQCSWPRRRRRRRGQSKQQSIARGASGRRGQRRREPAFLFGGEFVFFLPCVCFFNKLFIVFNLKVGKQCGRPEGDDVPCYSRPLLVHTSALAITRNSTLCGDYHIQPQRSWPYRLCTSLRCRRGRRLLSRDECHRRSPPAGTLPPSPLRKWWPHPRPSQIRRPSPARRAARSQVGLIVGVILI